MSTNKRVAIKLLKRGLSYSQINSRLGVAKSTINNWFSSLSEKEKNEIIKFRLSNWKKSIKSYQRKRSQKILAVEKQIQKDAAKKIGNLSPRELLLTGIALYWGEGTKRDRWALQFSNSDPHMIAIILRFFKEICGISDSQLYLQMILHQNIKEEVARNYWSKITKLPEDQFQKACFSKSKSSKGKRAENRLPYGTLQVRIFNKKVTHKIYGYIEGVKKTAVVH